MFEITYSDGRTTWKKRGNWKDLPDAGVQVVDYIQIDGARVRLAGFDSYYLAGILWGGTYDEARRWRIPGWQYELHPGRPASLVGPRGLPEGALVKRGSLIPNHLAARLNLQAGVAGGR